MSRLWKIVLLVAAVLVVVFVGLRFMGGGKEAPAGDASAAEWAATARAAFAEGYSEASGRDLAENRAVVDAFEVDKALYETVYEARNRPTWLEIPVAALRRLSTRPARLS